MKQKKRKHFIKVRHFLFFKRRKEIFINFIETIISNFIPLNYHTAVEKNMTMKLNILTEYLIKINIKVQIS